MDKILSSLKAIRVRYVLAEARAKKIAQLVTEIEDLLSEQEDDVKGYAKAVTKLIKADTKGLKTKVFGERCLSIISEIKGIQKNSLVAHYQSKKQVKNTTKEDK